MQDMDDERGAAVGNRAEELSDGTEQEQPVKAEKPRGKCTGCSFDYQLGTARTGEHKGKQVIRKHNSRTGPGLCSGAQQPPEGSDTHEYVDPETGVGIEHPDTREQCGLPECCSSAPHGRSDTAPLLDGRTAMASEINEILPGDVVGVAPGGVPITVTRLDAVGTPVGEPFDAVGAITLGTRPVDPWTGPGTVQDMIDDLGSVPVDPHAAEATAAISAIAADDMLRARESVAAPDPWSAPAPASLIPESTTTVSGQPEPDRDQYGRYLLPIEGKRQPATRATTFAKLGANTKAIEAWNERNVIRGLTLRPDLLMLANGLEVKRDRNDLNSIAAQAKDAAGSKVAANIGTAYHAFSERIDAGLIHLPDIPPQYRDRVRQYHEATRTAGLVTRPEWIERTTAVSAGQVGAPLPVAGTLDRIFQLPDGSLVIGDLKTGSDLWYGEMEIEVQLALYAHGVNTHGLFDWNTKTWQVTTQDDPAHGVRVRTDIAIVVHLPADGDGCTLYVADIERGWRDAQRLGPLQASLKEKNRFRELTAADLAPRPAPVGRDEVSRAMAPVGQGEVAQYLAAQLVPVAKNHSETPLLGEHWNRAKNLVAHADSQEEIAQIYQFALDSGRFHVDQLAVLVGLGKDRLNALARG